MPRIVKPFINQDGYLLLETLITASILLTLFPLVVLKSTAWYDHEETEQFLKSFEALMYDAQLTSLNERQTVNIELNDTTHEVYEYISPLVHLQTIQAPPFVHFQAGSLPLHIRYTAQGTIAQAGAIVLTTPSTSYQVVVLLGQGRFYVKEQ